MADNCDESGGVPPSAPDGAATPDSRERPALFGDMVEADIDWLRSLANGQSDIAFFQRICGIANRMEVLIGAYNTSLRRECQEVSNGR